MNEPKGCPTPGACSALEHLAASQAREAKLRQALEYFGTLKLSDGTYADKCCVAVAALSIPTDDTALQQRLAEEREKCMKACAATPVLRDGFHEYTALAVQELMINAIRDMK